MEIISILHLAILEESSIFAMCSTRNYFLKAANLLRTKPMPLLDSAKISKFFGFAKETSTENSNKKEQR